MITIFFRNAFAHTSTILEPQILKLFYRGRQWKGKVFTNVGKTTITIMRTLESDEACLIITSYHQKKQKKKKGKEDEACLLSVV